jgi:hypothetical protein
MAPETATDELEQLRQRAAEAHAAVRTAQDEHRRG